MERYKEVRRELPAKINIGLDILKRREDGFHDIETLLVPVSLFDTLVVRRVEPGMGTWTCSDPALPLNENNLVIRALHEFKQCSGQNLSVDIDLTKRIPAGAGLGGGSSDAAGMLKILNELCDFSLDNQVLLELAAKLGSDVPFFMGNGPALAAGRGERLSPAFFPTLPVTIITPSIRVSTGWAYHATDLSLTKRSDFNIFKVYGFRENTDRNSDDDVWTAIRESVSNDFETVIFDIHPDLGEVREQLEQQGALMAGLSGSGSSLFAVFAPGTKHAADGLLRSGWREYSVTTTQHI